eukprot:g127.t1
MPKLVKQAGGGMAKGPAKGPGSPKKALRKNSAAGGSSGTSELLSTSGMEDASDELLMVRKLPAAREFLLVAINLNPHLRARERFLLDPGKEPVADPPSLNELRRRMNVSPYSAISDGTSAMISQSSSVAFAPGGEGTGAGGLGGTTPPTANTPVIPSTTPANDTSLASSLGKDTSAGSSGGATTQQGGAGGTPFPSTLGDRQSETLAEQASGAIRIATPAGAADDIRVRDIQARGSSEAGRPSSEEKQIEGHEDFFYHRSYRIRDCFCRIVVRYEDNADALGGFIDAFVNLRNLKDPPKPSLRFPNVPSVGGSDANENFKALAEFVRVKLKIFDELNKAQLAMDPRGVFRQHVYDHRMEENRKIKKKGGEDKRTIFDPMFDAIEFCGGQIGRGYSSMRRTLLGGPKTRADEDHGDRAGATAEGEGDRDRHGEQVEDSERYATKRYLY